MSKLPYQKGKTGRILVKGVKVPIDITSRPYAHSYRHGWEAAHRGDPKSSCPYRQAGGSEYETEHYNHWIRGYDDFIGP